MSDRTTYIVNPEIALKKSLVEHAKEKMLYHEVAPIFEAVNARDTNREVVFLLDAIFEHHGPGQKYIVDLGCGVGRHTQHLMKYHKMTGVDISNDMLAVARKNCPGVDFYGMDMRDVGSLVPKTFDIAICMWTTFNYMSLDSDVRKWFSGLTQVLEPGGLVIIDLKNGQNLKPYKERTIPEGIVRVFKERRGNICHSLYVYSRPDGSFWADQELNRIFEVDEIQALAGSDFELLKVYGGYDTYIEPSPTSDRTIVVLAKK